jgi:hypothetical protein
MMGAACEKIEVEVSYGEGRMKFEELIDYLESGEAKSLHPADLERALEGRGRELLRVLLQDHIDLRGRGEATERVVDANGQQRTRTRVHERTLTTVFGDVKVERYGYGAAGRESLHPLDAEMNLPLEQYSLEMRHRVAEEAAKGSFEEVGASIEARTGVGIGKRQLEELTVRAAVDFDAFYDGRQHAGSDDAGTDAVLVISIDGKGVVMRKEDLRPQTGRAARRERRRYQRRLAKGEKRNRKRMATVASVYAIAAEPRRPEDILRTLAPAPQPERRRRPRPQGKRVWASVEKEPAEVVAEAFEEAQRRDPEHKRPWVAVVDGNEHQLDLLQWYRGIYEVELETVLDFIHVCEYVWKAAHALHAEGSKELEQWVSERLERILRGEAVQVAAGMRRSATRRGLGAARRKSIDVCANYLLKYQAYLDYPRYLACGYPIASGVIEGACRHLVKDRMDLTGARWRLSGAEAVLKLRALRASGDFEEYWRFHEAREQERNHLSRYRDNRLPEIIRPDLPNRRTSRLRRVK